jgi:hypothetical protein
VRARQSKPKTSELARTTFRALEPWVNVWCWGDTYQLPGETKIGYTITQEMWELFRRHRAGERGLRYPNGYRFQAWHVGANKLQARDIQHMLDGEKRVYFTGGRRGQTILMVDVDAHTDEQDDPDRTCKLICDFLGDCVFVVRSSRGYNLFLKIHYGGLGWEDYNKGVKEFEARLKAYCRANGCKCGVEVKGTITVDDSHYGSLAKLPCYGPWDEERLAAFVATPPRRVDWLTRKTAELETATPKGPPKVKARRGSTSGLPFGVEEFHALDTREHRNRVVPYLYAYHVAPRRGRLLREDLSIAVRVLALLRPNEDGSMPSARVKKVWCRLYQTGEVARAWDDSRWSAIWRTLADCGFLLVEDTNYWFIAGKHEGRAMRWRLNPDCPLGGGERAVSLQEAPSELPLRRPGLYRPCLVPAPAFDYLEWTPDRLTEFLLGQRAADAWGGRGAVREGRKEGGPCALNGGP